MPRPMTVAEKILAAHAGLEEVRPGQLVECDVDIVLANDITAPIAIDVFRELGATEVFDRDRVCLVPDHYAPNKDIKSAEQTKKMRDFAHEQHVTHYWEQGCAGIEHALLPEQGIVKAGQVIIGADSHTCTYGALGAFSTGVGSTDAGVGLATGRAWFKVPPTIKFEIEGDLVDGASAKDVILKVLQILSVKGGVGKIVEYAGEGVKSLTVPERATITNMGAELGATTSIFPSDEVTHAFLKAQGREEDYMPLAADADAVYDEVIEIDLSALEPLAACPHSPDNVKPVRSLSMTKVDQVCIGSCTNSSYSDLMTVAEILKGKTVSPEVSLAIAPGSRQVLAMLSANGALTALLDAGARILESACGPCIGMGQSPNSAGVSLRTFNRNFEGRSGTRDAGVYLVSPETAAVSCLTGYITDPTSVPAAAPVAMPEAFPINDNMVDLPASEDEYESVEVLHGPNIKPLPVAQPLTDTMELPCLLKVGDNITTDHIMPAGSKILPYRSNIPHLANYCFEVCDPEFPARAMAAEGGFIVGGANYGQGSSREHAALVPLYLGIRAVVTVSFARIHKANLVNAGILPLEFENAADYEKISLGDTLELSGVIAGIENGAVTLTNKTTGCVIPLRCDISARQAQIIRAGGLLNYTREKNR